MPVKSRRTRTRRDKSPELQLKANMLIREVPAEGAPAPEGGEEVGEEKRWVRKEEVGSRVRTKDERVRRTFPVRHHLLPPLSALQLQDSPVRPSHGAWDLGSLRQTPLCCQESTERISALLGKGLSTTVHPFPRRYRALRGHVHVQVAGTSPLCEGPF